MSDHKLTNDPHMVTTLVLKHSKLICQIQLKMNDSMISEFPHLLPQNFQTVVRLHCPHKLTFKIAFHYLSNPEINISV